MSSANALGTSDIRDTNRKIVLRCIWRDQPISRADVARVTRINKSSVSNIVNGLLKEEIIREEASVITQIGRTPILITINAVKYHFIAFDVRPSETILAIYDLNGKNIAEETLPAPGKSTPTKFIQMLAEQTGALCRKKRIPLKAIRALGAAFPGQVSREDGVVLQASNLGWSNVPVQDIFLTKLGKKIDTHIDNAANQALRAELWRGHSVPENLTGVYIDINESIESGIILDGKILSGRKFGLGAFGRMRLLKADKEAKSSTWEELLSLKDLIRRYKNSKAEHISDIPSALLDLREAYLKNSTSAKSVLTEEAHWLALGLSNIILTLGFPTIVVGGYIRSIWDLIQEQVFSECESLTGHAFPLAHEIRLSSLNCRESLEGAALSAIGMVIPLDIISMLTNEHKALIEKKILIR